MDNRSNFASFINKEVKTVETVLAKKVDTYDVLPPRLKFIINQHDEGKSVRIKITDPEDFVPASESEEPSILKWEHTILVRKVGSYPVDEQDGTVLIDNYERNHYFNESFIIDECSEEELNSGVYYKAWSIFENGNKGTSEEYSEIHVDGGGGN